METSERLTMTIREFSKAAGCSTNLAYRLAKQDRLGVKVIYLGKRMVLSRRAVLAWLEGNGNGEVEHG
jgi:hypothetical protein